MICSFFSHDKSPIGDINFGAAGGGPGSHHKKSNPTDVCDSSELETLISALC